MPAFLLALPGLLDTVLKAILPDPGARAQAIVQVMTLFAQSDQAQADINKTEAQHPSIFVAGWRPYIGWVCGFALTYQFVVVPLVMWATLWAGYNLPQPPTFDANLWELMFGMLGIGALRSYDKIKGVATSVIGR